MASSSIKVPEPVQPQVILTLTLAEAIALFWNIDTVKVGQEHEDFVLLNNIEKSLAEIEEVNNSHHPSWFGF